MTAGKVILVLFRVLIKKMTGTMCVSADFYLEFFIYVKYSLLYVKYRFLKKNSGYLFGVKINLGTSLGLKLIWATPTYRDSGTF